MSGGERPVRFGRWLVGYACPACGCADLLAESTRSPLDNKSFWKCDGCGKRLGANRPLVVSLIYLAFAVLGTLAAWAIGVIVLYSAVTRFEDFQRFKPIGRFSPPVIVALLLFGMVAAPVGLLFVARELRQPRPKRLPQAGKGSSG
jgi:hypothetical protein